MYAAPLSSPIRRAVLAHIIHVGEEEGVVIQLPEIRSVDEMNGFLRISYGGCGGANLRAGGTLSLQMAALMDLHVVFLFWFFRRSNLSSRSHFRLYCTIASLDFLPPKGDTEKLDR